MRNPVGEKVPMQDLMGDLMGVVMNEKGKSMLAVFETAFVVLVISFLVTQVIVPIVKPDSVKEISYAHVSY